MSNAADIFANAGLDPARTEALVQEALTGLDDGELFLQYTLSESFAFDDGRLKAATFDTSQGFGLRGVMGETTAFAHSNELSEAAIKRAGLTMSAVRAGFDGTWSDAPRRTNQVLYRPDSPFDGFDFAAKVKLIQDVDAFARASDPRVVQASVSLLGSWSVVEILRPDGYRARDVRPLVRLNVQLVLADGDRRETGYHGFGGRTDYARMFDPTHWQAAADEALRQAQVNLRSEPAPAGEMTVVLGPGWPGVLLHEAVGHGLEGDFNRKKTSAFAGLLGERVAAPGVTVIDDGTLENRRGSLSIDDEGTPTERTVLIEDGILKGYMQDRMNARLMGARPTGNGRRESFAHQPMPRMTNTFMLAGQENPDDILRGVTSGIYARTFGGGQVDITSGKFVFSCTEAYRIEDGQLGAPLKGATLIGNGPDVLKRVSAIGNDLALDDGIGTCGKAGQSIPAGVGQPTLRIDGLTVGGTVG
jgi:TldD protein